MITLFTYIVLFIGAGFVLAAVLAGTVFILFIVFGLLAGVVKMFVN